MLSVRTPYESAAKNLALAANKPIYSRPDSSSAFGGLRKTRCICSCHSCTYVKVSQVENTTIFVILNFLVTRLISLAGSLGNFRLNENLRADNSPTAYTNLCFVLLWAYPFRVQPGRYFRLSRALALALLVTRPFLPSYSSFSPTR
jgi:hypothetical protein